MQDKSRLKLISIFIGIFLYMVMAPIYALGGAVTGTGDATRGAHEWVNNCGACHNLRSPTEFTSLNWETIIMHMRIQAGITGQVARDIYAFLASHSELTQGPSTGTTTQVKSNAVVQNTNTSTNKSSVTNATTTQSRPSKSGAAIYRKTCITCHGANGTGAIPGAPDFTSPNGPLKNSDATLESRVINGYQQTGSPMAMPPKGGNSELTDEEVKAVIQYIRESFSKG